MKNLLELIFELVLELYEKCVIQINISFLITAMINLSSFYYYSIDI